MAVRVEELKQAIDQAIDIAEQDLKESQLVVPNSYGHGFDVGYLYAMRDVLEMLEEYGF